MPKYLNPDPRPTWIELGQVSVEQIEQVRQIVQFSCGDIAHFIIPW